MSSLLLATAYPGGVLAIVCLIIWAVAGAIGSFLTVLAAATWFRRRKWPRFFRGTAEQAVRLVAAASIALVATLVFEMSDRLERRTDLYTIVREVRMYHQPFAISLAVLAVAVWMRAISRKSELDEPAVPR
jgi:hypothetical protein